jgi:hypothetical protein
VAPTDVNAAGTGLNAGATVSIVYDVTGCGGSGYFALDTGGNQIPSPTEVMPFHELAIAFHRANNDFSTATPEPQAETDENLLRDQEGIADRDINNHGGGCSGGAGGGGSTCFIVAAAYGSPNAPQIRAFSICATAFSAALRSAT